MVSQIDGLIGLVSAATKIRPQGGTSASSNTQQTASSSEDRLDLSSDQVVDAVRVQAGLLLNELPALLAEALLASTINSAAQAEPLNNLLFRLVNPLDSILGRLPSEDLPESIILGLQEEIQSFRNSLPELANSALLTQLSNPLDDLLNRLAALG